MFTQIGTDAVSQVLKEFWPDVKQKWFHKRDGNVPVALPEEVPETRAPRRTPQSWDV
jgi:hypothetical protein